MPRSVPRVRLALLGHSSRIPLGPDQRLTTDAEGRFRTLPQPVGLLDLWVDAPDGQKASLAKVVLPDGEEDLGVIHLTPLGTASTDAFPRNKASVAPPSEETDGRVPWESGRRRDDGRNRFALDKVGVFRLQRMANGEVVLHGAPSDFFQQVERAGTGQFEAYFTARGEYRLTFSAAGYQDAAVEPPRVDELKFIPGTVVLMHKNSHGPAPAIARRTIHGTVTRQGQPVPSGWVALWSLAKPSNVINASVMRGRTVVESPRVFATPLRAGAYSVDVPFPSDTWYVVVEEPGHPLTQVGPIPIGWNASRTLDIACIEGSRIRGRVKAVPPGWEAHLWVIAFSKTAIHEEARVAPDGTFSLPPLPPGEYGLKVGHNAYQDAEVYPGSLDDAPPDAYYEKADPWKRATVVKVTAGRETVGVELELPK